jgi:hypothetical protein
VVGIPYLKHLDRTSLLLDGPPERLQSFLHDAVIAAHLLDDIVTLAQFIFQFLNLVEQSVCGGADLLEMHGEGPEMGVERGGGLEFSDGVHSGAPQESEWARQGFFGLMADTTSVARRRRSMHRRGAERAAKAAANAGGACLLYGPAGERIGICWRLIVDDPG